MAKYKVTRQGPYGQAPETQTYDAEGAVVSDVGGRLDLLDSKGGTVASFRDGHWLEYVRVGR
jgi:hypothetical protein